jgi:hypothetical protein
LSSLSSSRAGRFAANVLLVTASTCFALGVIEVALRVLDVDVASYHAIGGFTTYDPELGWVLTPSRQTIFRGAHFTVRVLQNGEGLRARHYPYARDPARRRIVVLGDSAVWCWGVEASECFTALLEDSLEQTDVINTGVPAWSTAQEMLFYEREGRRYGADLVLLLVVPNDPWENVAGYGPRFRLDGERLVETHVPVPRRKNAATEWLQAHSNLFAQMTYLTTVTVRTIGAQVAALRRRRTHRAPNPPEATSSPVEEGSFAREALPRDDPSYAVTEALLGRLADDVHADGARFALVLEAMPRRMGDRIREFSRVRNIPCIDLGPPLQQAEARGVRTRLQGDPHLGVEGQAIAAATIRDFLARNPPSLATTVPE